MRILTSSLVLSLTLSVFAADWPQWRGPNRDGVNLEKGLAAEWPEDGPKLLYKTTGVGAGFSSVVVAADTVYTLGDLDDACYLFALDLKGKHKWKSRIGEPKGHRGYPGPRSTPTVANGHVYALGQHGDLVCVSTEGKEVWRVLCAQDIERFQHSRRQTMAGSSTPAIAGQFAWFGHDDGSLRAVDKSGKVVWEYRVGVPIKTSPVVSGNLVLVHDFAGNFWCFTGNWLCSIRGPD